MIHNAISTSTIRFCSTGKPILADFDEFSYTTTECNPNRDLGCLALAIIQCMNGEPKEELQNIDKVRRLRESNKTFGLSNGERWSGYKLLIDFLDNMLDINIPATVKLGKPVNANSSNSVSR